MSKPLSQDEIDALLEMRHQIGEGDDFDLGTLESIGGIEAKRPVNPYNFKRPRLFSQDQMRVLNQIHEAFARDLSVYLSAQLRTIVDIALTAVDQVIYSEYVMASVPPSALYVVGVQEQGQKIVFELDPRLVIYTIEKLFGGAGVFLRRPREVSLIERRTMSRVMGRAFRELEKAWEQVAAITLKEEAFESNAEFVQIIPSVEPALVSSFEVTIYDQRSFINICYPYILLERMIGRTGMRQWISSATTEVDPKVRRRYEEALRETRAELRAELGRVRLPVRELTELRTGDVIPLQRRTSEPVSVYVGEQEKFKAAAGASGRRRALRILDVVKPQEEDATDG